MSSPLDDIRKLYDAFDAPVVPLDCGKKCAPDNPSGKPFCCDICHAVPAAYRQEWAYLQPRTDLWHAWRGDECPADPTDPEELRADTPEHMLLLACKGPLECQRAYRAVSCRQFPFYPYISTRGRFAGLSYDWVFEQQCWVIQHLEAVTQAYRAEFVRLYDRLFASLSGDLDGYANYSEQARDYFRSQRRPLPLLHRNGRKYMLKIG